MADAQHLKLIKSGANEWNRWGVANPGRRRDLSGADLSNADLSNANLRETIFISTNLSGATLSGADLSKAEFSKANLSGANLSGSNLNKASLGRAKFIKANLIKANLSGANFSKADLGLADLSEAKLSLADFNLANLIGANLRAANLAGTGFRGANLRGADLTKAVCHETTFGDTDLSAVLGLDQCIHDGPSVIDHRTLVKSGPLPLAFLRGCGLPDTMIEYLPSLLNQPIQFYSCFISYSTKDQHFADRLYADLQNKGVRCWFAPHDMQGGKKLHEQIDEAIRVYDRLLLILSAASMDSEWVKTEIAKARKRELQEMRRMLFPVRLVEFETLQDWECSDSDAGKDSAREIREYYVPDFSNWKDHDAYQKVFEKLLRDLKSKDKLKDS